MDKIQRKQFSKEERQNILDKTDGQCGHCGKKLDTASMTIDHIFPLYKGGTHDEYNLIALCSECNSDKSNFVYDLEDYYKFIGCNHYTRYKECFSELKIKARNNHSMLDVDTKLYRYIPYQAKMMLNNMKSRKVPKKKIAEMAGKCMATLKLEKAYEADAESIHKLITRVDSRVSLASASMYDNEYKILNAIKYDEVYVLRSPDRVCGAFFFTRISDDNKVGLVQVNNMEDVTCLRQKYIMTYGYVDALYSSVYPQIMEDFTLAFLRVLAIPMYFNIINDSVYSEYQSNYMSVPWELNGVSGRIEILILSKVRERMRESMRFELDRGAIKSETVDNWIETMLEHRDMEEKELMLYRNKVEIEMYNEAYINMLDEFMEE